MGWMTGPGVVTNREPYDAKNVSPAHELQDNRSMGKVIIPVYSSVCTLTPTPRNHLIRSVRTSWNPSVMMVLGAL